MQRSGSWVLLAFAALGLLFAAVAQDATRAEADLRRLRTQIQSIRGQVAKDAAERDRLARSLRAAEQSAGVARTQLKQLQGERDERERRREDLIRERNDRAATLESERAALASQMHAAYLMGRDEPLKLLLNQRDPARAGRMFAYYGYFGRARAEQIAKIDGAVVQLSKLSAQVETEQQRLARLAEQQSGEVTRLEQAREERGQVLAQLTTEARSREAALARLQREQAALEKLLRELRKAAPKFPSDNKSPFAAMRGKLAWPVAGKLAARFGERRAGAVKWDGVLISAVRETPVRAVYQGRVVYADWLAGLGLLLIVDHGDGYISLYGHNDQLFVAVGTRVAAGDTVASVGDTGGRSAPELYFEIRRAAQPVDPQPWFREKQP